MPVTASTTGAMSWEFAELEMSTDGPSTWININNATNQVDNVGGDVATATAFTHTSFIPLVGYGPAALREINLMGLYTENNAEAFYLVRQAYKNRSNTWLRFTPKGISSGNKRYVTTQGRITKFKDPSGQAGTANFVVLQATWTGSFVNEETI